MPLHSRTQVPMHTAFVTSHLATRDTRTSLLTKGPRLWDWFVPTNPRQKKPIHWVAYLQMTSVPLWPPMTAYDNTITQAGWMNPEKP